MRLSDGYALEPEQSTLAMIAHHPQAVYFGMRNGRLLPDGRRADDVIKGSPRDPSLFASRRRRAGRGRRRHRPARRRGARV